MMRNKRVLAIAISLLMAISVLPGMAFAAEEQSLEDYTGLQQGTTSTRIYMLNCGDLEETFPAVFGDDNEYASRWDIKTDTSKTEWFDNYIMDAPDTRAEVEFVFSIGGGGMNNLSDDEGKGFIKGAEIPDCAFKTGVADHVKVLNASGGSQPRIISMIFTPHSGSGGGTGGGPSRAVDVIVKIAPNTLNANETYKLALTSGLSSGRDALDKDIYFTFTTAPILVEEITFGDSTAQLKPGETKDLTATVLPENATDKNMTWTSSDESVAKVSGSGTITAVNPGKATITATAQDGSGISAACEITVNPIVEDPIAEKPIKAKKITLNANRVTLEEDASYMLKASVAPEGTTNKAIEWTTSDAKIATVGETGTIKAICAGNAVITATAKDGSGAKATCQVKVDPVFSKISMKAASTGHDSIKLSWSKDKKADGYRVYRRTAENKNFKAIADTKKQGYVDKKLATGQKYAYKVRTYRTIGNKKVYGRYSTIKSVKPIPAPVKAKVKAGKGKVTVKWNPVSGATKYVVYKSTKKNKGYYKAKITVKTAFTDTDVKSGKTYYYKVRNYKTMKGKKIYGKYTKAFQIKAK